MGEASRLRRNCEDTLAIRQSGFHRCTRRRAQRVEERERHDLKPQTVAKPRAFTVRSEFLNSERRCFKTAVNPSLLIARDCPRRRLPMAGCSLTFSICEVCAFRLAVRTSDLLLLPCDRLLKALLLLGDGRF